ncbi:MAG: alpha-glucosidase C-terminal domain-containing protein, partial [Caldibacillus sp.]
GQDEVKVMESIYAKGRDNARTPMQWDDSPNAGFTTGTPWIGVNPNYKEINVRQALADKNSIFYYYQKLIRLRKTYPIIVYGDFTLLDPENEETFAYIRCYNGEKLLVVSNWTGEEVLFTMPETAEFTPRELLIANYDDAVIPPGRVLVLRPWEALVYRGE